MSYKKTSWLLSICMQICMVYFSFYVEWSVAQPEDLAKGYHHVTKTEINFMLYLYAPKHPKQVYGILDDKNTLYSSPLYGGGNRIMSTTACPRPCLIRTPIGWTSLQRFIQCLTQTLVTTRIRSLWEGNSFSHVFLSVCSHGVPHVTTWLHYGITYHMDPSPRCSPCIY